MFRRGKLHTALQYLEQALRIEVAAPGGESPACTHLNMCAVLSQLARHEQALLHARSAIEILREEPNTNVLAIAYHNLAVEQEHLGLVLDAERSYTRAAEVLNL